MIWKKDPTLKIGDLVYHVMYGEEWLGVVLTFADEPDALTGNSRAKVHMVPGTEYEKFFQKSWTRTDQTTQGWVSSKWLVKLMQDA